MSRHYPTIEKTKSKPTDQEKENQAPSEKGSTEKDKEKAKAKVRKVIADLLRQQGGKGKLETIATTPVVCEARGNTIRKLGKFLQAFPEFKVYDKKTSDPGSTPAKMVKLIVDASKSNKESTEEKDEKKKKEKKKEKLPTEEEESSAKHVVLDPKSEKDKPKLVVRDAVSNLLQREGGKASLCFIAGDPKVKASRKGAAKNLTYFLQSQSDIFKVYTKKFVGQKGHEGSKVMVKLTGDSYIAAQKRKEEEVPKLKKRSKLKRGKGAKASKEEPHASDDEEQEEDKAPMVKKRKKSKSDAQEAKD